MRRSAHFGGWVNRVARPHFAKSRFHLQLAGGVLVGNARGDPGATALRTGAPLGALRRAGGGRWDECVQWMMPREKRPRAGFPRG